MIERIINIPKSQSFFLLGPRQTGKTTFLQHQFPKALWLNLLEDSLFQRLLRSPDLLAEMVRAKPKEMWVVIDEVQKIPELLNIVHLLIEERKQKFILTGSSARKLKGHGVNLLAGRALEKKFHPLTAEELGETFDLRRALQYGQLPAVFTSESPRELLDTYVGMYLKEEVQQEALVRRLDQFARFMEIAAFSQGQVLSVLSVASDVGVSRNTAESYFQILEDLLLAVRIPVFQKKSKRKISTHPKFYFFDVGIYRALRKTGPLDPIEEIEGVAIESLVFQELRACIDNHAIDAKLYFYRTQSKSEVDFIIYGPDSFTAIEVKRSSRIQSKDLNSLREFISDYPKATALLFYLGNEERMTDDGIQLKPLRKALLDLKDILLNVRKRASTDIG